jgi:hypothetical protein
MRRYIPEGRILLSPLLINGVYFVLGTLHCVDIGDVADVFEALDATIFNADTVRSLETSEQPFALTRLLHQMYTFPAMRIPNLAIFMSLNVSEFCPSVCHAADALYR